MTCHSARVFAPPRGWPTFLIRSFVVLAMLGGAALPARAAGHGAGRSIAELREGAESLARIFENVGTYPGPFFKGKVTLTPPPVPTVAPILPTTDDIGWSSRFSLPVFDGDVTSLVQYRGHWVAAGYFGAAPGTGARGIAEWDGQRWRDMSAGLGGLTAATYTLASDGTSLYAGGRYDVRVMNVVTRQAVLRWTGDHWEPLALQDDGIVYALRMIRGSLYAAGEFYDSDTRTSYPLARWTGSAWVRVGAKLAGLATAVAEHDGQLVIAGSFRSPETWLPAPLVVALETPANWKVLARQDTVYSHVSALESFGGKLYAAGSLSGLGASQAAIASWDGASWTAENLSGYVTSLVTSGGKLWAGGEVWSIDGLFVYQSGGVAALEGAQWTIPGDDPDGRINALAATSGRPAMAGLFGAFNYRRPDPRLAAIPIAGHAVVEDRPGGWSAVAVSLATEAGLGSFYGYPPEVRLDLVDGVPWAYGDFQFVRAGGSWTQLSGIARWSDGGWVSPVPNGVENAFGPYPWPNQVIKYNGVVYAGFQYGLPIGAVPAALVRLGDNGWEAVPGAPDQGVFTLAVHQGSLIVAGRFTSAGGAPASSIARFDGNNWSTLGDASVAVSTPELVPTIVALLSDGADLWAGGSFTSVGGVSAQGIARWDGAAWRAAGAGLESNVYVISRYRGQVVAGGDFFYSGSEFTGGLARWDGSAWHQIGSVTVSGVRALAEARGSLYVGGYLWILPSSAAGLARFDGQKWEALGSGLAATNQSSGYVRSLLAIGDELWVSGRFSLAGRRPAYSVSTWNLRTGSFGVPSAAPPTAGIKASALVGKIGVRVSFSMEREGLAELGVFDVRGARVSMIARDRFTAGTHEVEWDGRGASGSAVRPGIYFLQLRVDGVVVASGRAVTLR